MTVVIQRPLKGSRISSFYPVKSLPPLTALESAFQLQEYISLLIRLDVHDVDRIVSIPGRGTYEGQDDGEVKEEKETERDGTNGVNVDEACWVYEQLRRLAQDLSHPLITMLQQECTRSTCPEMKAGEWLYLCVAHGNEGAMEQCCAIDYILHTLDSATALLNSPRAFPSRLSVPPTSHRHFSSLARRLGRIFAHAYFHHREAFEQAEAESSLYARFLALTSKFDLVPAEFLVIPPRLTPMSDDERGSRTEHVEPPRLLGAALDPRRGLGRGDEWPSEHDSGHDMRGTSPPGPAGQRRNESPRKFGRNRTDTMVYSEAFSVAEELAKGDLSEVDIDREIAAQRAAAAVDADNNISSAPFQLSVQTAAEVPVVEHASPVVAEHHERPEYASEEEEAYHEESTGSEAELADAEAAAPASAEMTASGGLVQMVGEVSVSEQQPSDATVENEEVGVQPEAEGGAEEAQEPEEEEEEEEPEAQAKAQAEVEAAVEAVVEAQVVVEEGEEADEEEEEEAGEAQIQTQAAAEAGAGEEEEEDDDGEDEAEDPPAAIEGDKLADTSVEDNALANSSVEAASSAASTSTEPVEASSPEAATVMHAPTEHHSEATPESANETSETESSDAAELESPAEPNHTTAEHEKSDTDPEATPQDS